MGQLLQEFILNFNLPRILVWNWSHRLEAMAIVYSMAVPCTMVTPRDALTTSHRWPGTGASLLCQSDEGVTFLWRECPPRLTRSLNPLWSTRVVSPPGQQEVAECCASWFFSGHIHSFRIHFLNSNYTFLSMCLVISLDVAMIRVKDYYLPLNCVCVHMITVAKIQVMIIIYCIVFRISATDINVWP